MAPERKLYQKIKKHFNEFSLIRLENLSLSGTPDLLVYNNNRAEALGPCSSKLVERNIYLYRGSCITELVAQGLKLEPCCLGLEACASFLSKLGA
jgi:hypothetical protein